jgi:hypothetical protein
VKSCESLSVGVVCSKSTATCKILFEEASTLPLLRQFCHFRCQFYHYFALFCAYQGGRTLHAVWNAPELFNGRFFGYCSLSVLWEDVPVGGGHVGSLPAVNNRQERFFRFLECFYAEQGAVGGVDKNF